MTRLHVAGAVALAAAALLLLSVQFVPWSSGETVATTPGVISMEGIHFGHGAFLWYADFSGDAVGWYSGDLNGEPGVGAIRTAVPLVVLSLLLAAGACVLQVLRYGNAAGAASAAAAASGVVGTAMFVGGVTWFFRPEWGAASSSWGPGLTLAVLALLALGAGAVMALMPPDEDRRGPARRGAM